MASKNLILRMRPNIATILSPNRSCKEEFQLWREVKSSTLKAMSANNRGRHAIAISPADDPKIFLETDVQGKQCPPPYDDCYLMTPQAWPPRVLEELGASMSFELGQLWFFEPPGEPATRHFNADELAQLLDIIDKCSKDEDYVCTSMELLGCVADDTCVVWHGGKDVEARLRPTLEETLRGNDSRWNLSVDSTHH